MFLFSDWHNKFWFGVDSTEVKQAKAELEDAYRESQHPSRVGQMLYSACLDMRPNSLEPLVIQLQPLDGSEPEPLEETLRKMPMEFQLRHWEWKQYRERLSDAEEWMDRDREKQIKAVERIGECKKRLSELIGKPECERFCASLLRREMLTW